MGVGVGVGVVGEVRVGVRVEGVVRILGVRGGGIRSDR